MIWKMLTGEVGVVMPDHIIRQHAHELQLVPPAHGRQLERPEAHKARRHAAHHRPRLMLGIAAAK